MFMGEEFEECLCQLSKFDEMVLNVFMRMFFYEEGYYWRKVFISLFIIILIFD